MNLPDKSKKVQQENFSSYQELRSWLSSNGYKNKGYVLEEPWREFFVERWEKEGYIALSMDITDLPNFMSLPLKVLDKPFQVDIAKTEEFACVDSFLSGQ